MIKLKQKPEDFLVKEVLPEELAKEIFQDNHGEYTYYRLKKTNCNTMDAVTLIARSWRLDEKYINFAGTKDKVGVTEQFISIKNGPKKDLYVEHISLIHLGTGSTRMNLGVLEGNKFEIVVDSDNILRDLTKAINYFDEQRFGVNNNNHIIGRLFIQKKFSEICKLLSLDVENNNYIGAIRKLPKRLVKLYIHAYQSHIWNLTVKEYIKQNFTFYEIDFFNEKLPVPNVINDLSSLKIPIIGFGTSVENDKLRAIIEGLMAKEGINYRDFIIRELPELSSEGDERDMVMKISSLNVTDISQRSFVRKMLRMIRLAMHFFRIKKNEKETRTYNLSFFLGKGCYATVAVKSLFS